MTPQEVLCRPSEQEGVVNTLDILDVASYLATPEQRQKFLKELTFEDFTWLLTTLNESFTFDVNEVLDPNDNSAHWLVRAAVNEGAGTVKRYICDYAAPSQEHREPLLREAFAVAQRLEDTEQAATLLGLAIAVVHPFRDGNGRTGRVMYGLPTRGYDGSEQDRDYYRTLGSHGGRSILCFDPMAANLPGRYMAHYLASTGLGSEAGMPLYSLPQPGETLSWKLYRLQNGSKTQREALIGENYFSLGLIAQEIKKRGHDIRDYGQVEQDDFGNKMLTLQLDMVYPNPNLIDVGSLAARQSALKVAYARSVIACFDPANKASLATPEELVNVYHPKKEKTT